MTDRDLTWEQSWQRAKPTLKALTRADFNRRSKAVQPGGTSSVPPILDAICELLSAADADADVGATWVNHTVVVAAMVNRITGGATKGRDYRTLGVRSASAGGPDRAPAWAAKKLRRHEQSLRDAVLQLSRFVDRPWDPDTETGICERCDAERHQGANYCWSCGGFLKPPRAKEPEPTDEDRKELASRKRYKRCNRRGCPAREEGRRFPRDLAECPDCSSALRLAS